jgi:hypothetical protein
MFVRVQPLPAHRKAPLLSACALCLAVLLVGCGGGEKKEGLVEACGTVTLDGVPLVDAQVMFDHPMHPETFGRTDRHGFYEMSYTATQTGAFTGENEVSFTTADPEAGKEERIPKHYHLGKSVLKIEVTDGGGPYDFDLLTGDDAPATASSK